MITSLDAGRSGQVVVYVGVKGRDSVGSVVGTTTSRGGLNSEDEVKGEREWVPRPPVSIVKTPKPTKGPAPAVQVAIFKTHRIEVL